MVVESNISIWGDVFLPKDQKGYNGEKRDYFPFYMEPTLLTEVRHTIKEKKRNNDK